MKSQRKSNAKIPVNCRNGLNWIESLRSWGRQTAFICCLLSPILFVSFSAFSQVSLSVNPMEVQLKAPLQGGLVTDEIEVYNGGTVTLHIFDYVMDWNLTESGDFQFLDPGTHPRSCAKWIQTAPISFSLPPQKSVKVRYTITAPKALSAEHWAMIFFQSRPLPLKGSGLGMKFVNHEGSGFGMKFVTRVGCKVFLKPSQNLPLQGKIVDMIVQPESTTENLVNLVNLVNPGNSGNSGNSGNRGRVKVTFKNSGMTHVRLNGSFIIEDEVGKLIAKGELQPPRAQVLAGDSRVVWAELDKSLPTGIWNIKTIVDYGARELVAGELKVKGTPNAIVKVEKEGKGPGGL